MAEGPLRYLAFDIETVTDGELASRLRYPGEKLSAAEDFTPLHEPQCNIVAFRHVPAELRDVPSGRLGAFQLDLRRRIVRSGRFYIVPTTNRGVAALRATIINPLTTADHLDELIDALRETGRRLLD